MIDTPAASLQAPRHMQAECSLTGGRMRCRRRSSRPMVTAAVDTRLHAERHLGVWVAHALQAAQKQARGDRQDHRGAAGCAVHARAEAHAAAHALAQQRGHAPRGGARREAPGLRNLPERHCTFFRAVEQHMT